MTVNIFLLNCGTKHESNGLTPTLHTKLVNQLFYTMIVIARSLRRRQTDMLYVGESSLDIGEQTVGEMTRKRNDRLPFCVFFVPYAAGVLQARANEGERHKSQQAQATHREGITESNQLVH